jgi:predicted O-methyltransferase YrrM
MPLSPEVAPLEIQVQTQVLHSVAETEARVGPPPSPELAAEETTAAHIFFKRLRDNAYRNLNIRGYAPDNHGWIHPQFEPRMQSLSSAAIGAPLRILEVGSWKGHSSGILGKIARDRNDGSSVVCIDTWLGAPEFWTWGIDDPTRGISLGLNHGYPSVFYTFTRNMKSLGLENHVIPFPISSDQGFEVLRHYKATFDLIYVDAAHEENAVLRDMENAWSVLAPGGMLFGDDYTPNWPGVIAAVHRFIRARNLKGVADDVLWFVPKPAASFDDGAAAS